MSLENYGNYQLVKKLAMGGMAQIYLARRKVAEPSDELVVVKRILPHLAENVDFIRMFLDEARIAARLAHPNIVQIHDLGAQDDSFFLAMEYIHGEDVRRMCKRADSQGRPLPVSLACRIIIDACAGLDYAHKKTDPSGKPLNIVHRDVSPQNILVSFAGAVKVVDFGIAKAADQATVTRSGVLKGKYSYMSPEQAAGQRVDCRSDVFALGVVLYELVTGMRLFKRSSDMQTLSAVSECQVTPPSQVSPRVPPELSAIVMKALAKEPEARYAEALQLQVALEGWLGAQKHPATSTELSAFMRELYAERLAREARAGTVVVDEDPPATGQRAAVEGQRRSGIMPGPSTKEVTRAERGELVPAASFTAPATGPVPLDPAEVTDRTVQRPSRAMKSVEARRDSDAERPRAERRPTPRQTADVRRQEPEPRLATRPELEAPSRTDMTAPTSVSTRRWIAAIAATVSAVAVALLLWVYLRPAALPQATVRLETVPPGAKVVFDGRLLPGATPLVLPGMAQGNYPVTLSREGYQELRATVEIPATGTVTAPVLKLSPVPPPVKAPPPVVEKPPPPMVEKPPPAPVQVQLTLETEPAQATIFVDGVERGAGPLVVQAKAEQELEVRVNAAQYRPLSRKVKVGAGPAQRERFELEPLPKPAPPVAAGTIKQTRGEPPKPPPDAPRAMVRFAVTPWAEVSCGGRNLGTTPFEAVSLPVGVYQCKFHNPDLGRTLTQRVEVKATGLNKVVVKF
ncbi:protein kinase domain-containing protein [Hyalangium rubrum]|uniref:Protein kinase n=1 Tax=Hyalangium rubrum TaxID=3103134 RepID=A0ABU5GWE0_9BACT|nr:protein kinase [Hyalangium sp. s54d21]MDY7224877.1 protein kinase [Hyalangium sp. s54d21]